MTKTTALPPRLSAAVAGYAGVTAGAGDNRALAVGVLPGEGIGPEIIEPSLNALRVIESCRPFRFEFSFGGKIGKDALRESGMPLTPAVEDFCEAVFARQGAVMCGPGGVRFVYQLRRRFDLFCKLVPLLPLPALCNAGVLRPEAVAEVDILLVRENVSGLYFGATRLDGAPGGRVAHMDFSYTEQEVLRILRVAAAAAALRRGRLCVVTKPGATGALSELWEDCARALVKDKAIELQLLEVDHASYQLVAGAGQFDVVVAPNMFGDVLADGASLLLASRGMSFSANYGSGCRAVYQTGHGAAYDLAGSDRANPLGQMLSTAMMLHESFGLGEESLALRAAVDDVLAAGLRTRDIMAAGCREIGTRAMGEQVCDALRRRLESSCRAAA